MTCIPHPLSLAFHHKSELSVEKEEAAAGGIALVSARQAAAQAAIAAFFQDAMLQLRSGKEVR
jgi:hypothetical protein